MLMIIFISLALSINYCALTYGVASEESTTSSDYDYIINSRINEKKKQESSMKEFKEKVKDSVSGMEKGADELSSAVSSNQLKYGNAKGGEMLGNVYGTTGNLTLSESKYKKKSDFADSVTAATETEKLTGLATDDSNKYRERDLFTGTVHKPLENIPTHVPIPINQQPAPVPNNPVVPNNPSPLEENPPY